MALYCCALPDPLHMISTRTASVCVMVPAVPGHRHELRRLALNMFAAYALQPLHELSRSGNSDAWPCVIGLRSHRRGVCVSGHGTDVLAYSQTEDVERETDGM